MANINIKLDDVKDSDIIEFLEDKPKTFIIKEALEMYMVHYKAMKDPSKRIVVEQPQQPKTKTQQPVDTTNHNSAVSLLSEMVE